jgi:hypothetical protein
MNQALGSIYS